MHTTTHTSWSMQGAVPGSTNGAYAANGSAYARDNGGHVNISLAPSGSQLVRV